MVPGRLRLSLDVTGTYVDTAHDVDPAQYERDPATGLPRPNQAERHEVALTMFDFSLTGSLAFREWLALEARIPLRLVQSEAKFLDASGNELNDFESIHHRDETLFGIGDVELWDRFRVLGLGAGDETTLDLRLGLALPTGNLEDDPYLLGSQGRRHQHVFFGSGTLDPIGGVDLWHRLSGVTLNGYLNARATLYENPRGYRAGSRGSLGAAVQSGFGLERVTFIGGVELYHERPARWASGLEETEEEMTTAGRTSLIPGVGAVFAPSDALWLRARVLRPFNLASGGAELEIPLAINLGVDLSFDAFEQDQQAHAHVHGDDHDHDHDHDHAHDDRWIDELSRGATGKGDVSDLARGGSSFDLNAASSSGKITVIDFWAEWCEPCHDIDRLLRALAAKHSNLAVRRVEIIDFDSPAAVEHLRGVKGLPVVWVLDERGRRVETLVGTSARDVYEKLRQRLER